MSKVMDRPMPAKKKEQAIAVLRRVLWILALAALVAAVVCAIRLTVLEQEAEERKAALRSQIQGTWIRDGQEDWHLELRVEGDAMEYWFVSPKFPAQNENLYTYDIAPVTDTVLHVVFAEGSRDIAVSFSEDGREMTFTPAVTLTADSEVWTAKE